MEALPTPAEAEALVRERVAALPVESRRWRPWLAPYWRNRSCGARPAALRPRHHGRHCVCEQCWRAGQRRFRIAGIQPAGQPQMSLPAPDVCLEAMTGAVLPAAATASCLSRTSSSPTAGQRSMPTRVLRPTPMCMCAAWIAGKATCCWRADAPGRTRAGGAGLRRTAARRRARGAAHHDRLDGR